MAGQDQKTVSPSRRVTICRELARSIEAVNLGVAEHFDFCEAPRPPCACTPGLSNRSIRRLTGFPLGLADRAKIRGAPINKAEFAQRWFLNADQLFNWHRLIALGWRRAYTCDPFYRGIAYSFIISEIVKSTLATVSSGPVLCPSTWISIQKRTSEETIIEGRSMRLKLWRPMTAGSTRWI